MTSPWRRASLALAKRTPVRPVRSRLSGAFASIAFDDAPRSAVQGGAEILEHAGVRGSFYLCGGHTGGAFEGLAQHELGDARRLADAGHEIGCHGFSHLDATRTGDRALADDSEANRAWIFGEVGAPPPRSFAYPFGATSWSAKRFYARRFSTCRGVLSGVNAGLIDRAELRAYLLTSGRFDAARLQRLAAVARRRSGWIIFFTHDVAAAPSPFGCRPADLSTLITTLQDCGVDFLPVGEVAERALDPV